MEDVINEGKHADAPKTAVEGDGEVSQNNLDAERLIAAKRKANAEAKELKLKLREANEKLVRFEQDREESEHKKLEEQSQWKTLYESSKEKHKVELEESQKQLGGLLKQSVMSKVQQRGMELGCVNTEALSKLIDVNSIVVDKNSLTIEQDSIEVELERVKTLTPQIFQKTAPKVVDASPASVSSSQMTKEERDSQFSKLWNAQLKK